MHYLALLADAGLPTAKDAMVWGPLSVAGAVGLWMLVDWYIGVQKPRLKAKSINEQEAHDAHVKFVQDTTTNLGSLVHANAISAEASRVASHASQKTAEAIERFDGRVGRVENKTDEIGEHIAWIRAQWEHNRPCRTKEGNE